MDQDLALAQDPEEVAVASQVVGEAWRRHRHPGAVLEVGTVQLADVEEPAEVERCGDRVDVLVLDLQLARQQVDHLGGHVAAHLEADDER